MIEQFADETGAALIAFHMASERALQFLLGARGWSLAQLGLQSIVEVFVGIEFWAVRRQIEQLDVFLAFIDPGANLFGSVYL